MTTGQRIAQKRKEQNLSQEALGAQLGVSRQTIYKWEADAALPEIDKLIALSRLFGVTVGWLPGVEELEAAAPENTSAGSGELTEQQLSMVEEIVGRYLAAQPKPMPTGRRLFKIAAAVATLCLVGTLYSLSGKLDQLNSRYNNLQNQVSHIDSNVSSQISNITQRVEEVLKTQNELTADYSADLVSTDPAGGRPPSLPGPCPGRILRG